MKNPELCYTLETIMNNTYAKIPEHGFTELRKFLYEGKDTCAAVLDYGIPYGVASSIGFSCQDYKNCNIETDLVMPDWVENEIFLFETIDSCNIQAVHKHYGNKHVHLECKTNLFRLRDTIDDIIKLHSSIVFEDEEEELEVLT